MSRSLRVLLAIALISFISLISFTTFGVANKKSPPLPMIDLEQVMVAVEKANGATNADWVQDLEWRINQIYQGNHLVRMQVQARSIPGHISGYVEFKSKTGAVEPKMIFTVLLWKQKSGIYFDVKDHTGWVAYSRTYPLRKKAMFLGIFAARKLRYLTPNKRFVGLRLRRTKYRKSAMFQRRVKAHKLFMKKASTRKSRMRHFRRSPRRPGGKW